ncbi:MAG: MFS transporter [Bdellovibrionales bacterium]|nr:MFS transporter [Bdellovibrionales bacterium]
MIFKSPRFSPLFWVQFWGALNDNVLKNALVVLITFKGIEVFGIGTNSLVAFAGGVFILPFFLFSPLAGQISDRFEKSGLVRIIKFAEIAIMALAGIAFYFENYEALIVVLFLMGLQSTFFGPIKYSIIPQLVEREELTKANAYVEMGTFLAILIGTILGGIAAGIDNAIYVVTAAVIVFSIIGYLHSLKVPKVPLGDSNLNISVNPFPQFSEMWRLIREKKAVYNSVLGISWFWFFGAGILSLLPVYCKDYLGVSESVVTLFLAMFTIGIGVGSLICERLSHKSIEIGIVPFGSLGLTLFLLDIGLRPIAHFTSLGGVDIHPFSIAEFWKMDESGRILFDFLFMSLSGGIFIVPLYALIQDRADKNSLSRVIAGLNVMNAVFMVIASGFIMGLYAADLTVPKILAVFAVLNLIVGIYIYSIVPEFTLRFFGWTLSKILYRSRASGLENIPSDGPCLLICNHVSYIDWLIIYGACRRPVRFIMYYKFFEIPIIKTLMKHAQVIPIAGRNEDEKILEQAFVSARQKLNEGEVVCIFPEGGITPNGEIQEFKPGILKILGAHPVPVVPMALTGLWTSFFSREGGRAFLKWPNGFRRQIGLHVGAHLTPEGLDLNTMQSEVKKLMVD